MGLHLQHQDRFSCGVLIPCPSPWHLVLCYRAPCSHCVYPNQGCLRTLKTARKRQHLGTKPSKSFTSTWLLIASFPPL